VSLSTDLVSQFIKATQDTSTKETPSTLYGTIVEYDGRQWVRLDGSELLTPVTTTTNVSDGNRVSVSIENHSATVTGNISSPSATSGEVSKIADDITEFEIVMSYQVTTEDLEAVNATIEKLRVVLAKIDSLETIDLEAVYASITELEAKYADITHINAQDIEAITAIIESLDATFGTFTGVSTEDLEALNAEITNLRGYTASYTYVSAQALSALKADIKQLDADKLSATEADLKYANIDFSNIGEAAVEKLFTESGIIKDLIMSDGKVTGELVGVTIIGDYIKGGTVQADKLVIKGEDGLYYKLNIEGGATTSEQVSEEDLQNGLSGSIIVAKSITAEKVAVNDLVAFGATIGGFQITSDALYSGVKSSADNMTRGIYLDNDGQFVVGDTDNYLKFFKDTDGSYKLAISANSIAMSATGKSVEEVVQEAVDAADIRIGARNLIRNSETLKFEGYGFESWSSGVLGVGQVGLFTIGSSGTWASETASETEGPATTEDYSPQGFKDGMTLHDYHLIAMENAIVKALAGVASAKITTITLSATEWVGSGTIYSQSVYMEGVTANSKIDLLPSPEQLNDLLLAEISLTAANSNGAITVFAIGDIPSNDLELQAMITEVIVPEVSA
jgi:hypothetical protein